MAEESGFFHTRGIHTVTAKDDPKAQEAAAPNEPGPDIPTANHVVLKSFGKAVDGN